MRPALSDYQHLASGKVRELYRIDDDHLLFVATDRISAFDYVLDSDDPRQGPHPDRDERVLLRTRRRAQPPRRPARRSADSRRSAGPRAGGAPARDDARRVRGPRLSDRLGAAGLPEDRQGVRHRTAAGPGRGQQVRRRRCSRRPQKPNWGNTTRTSRSPRVVDDGRRRARQRTARPHVADLHAGRRPRADARESSSPTPSSSSASTATATWCWPTRCSPPTRRGTGLPTNTGWASCRTASTSSSSATG